MGTHSTRSMFRAMVGVCVALGGLLAPEAFAAPATSCSISPPSQSSFLGESATFTVKMTNTGGAAPFTGYAPAVELFLPASLTLTSVTAFGTALTFTGPTLVPASPNNFVTNPHNGEQVFGPAASRYYFIRFPLSSLVPATGAIAMTVTVAVSNAPAILNVPQVVHGTCLFSLGADALNNPITDAPIRSDLKSSAVDQATASTTPAVVRVTKRVSTNDTVTGPNFPVTYTVDVDVATGAVVTGTVINDAIDNAFQLVSVTAAGGTVLGPAPLPLTPGGAVSATFPSITGVAGVDRQLIITGFVAKNRASGAAVLDAVTGAPIPISNTATATGITFNAAILSNQTSTTQFNAHAVLIRETLANTSTPGQPFRPAEVGTVTQTVEVSDYFNLSAATVTTTLASGLTYVGGSSAPLVPAVAGDDPTTLTFTFPALTGGASGGTRSTNSFQAKVDETYGASGPAVLGGDVIATTHALAATIQGGNTRNLTEAASGSDASFSIGATAQTKTIYRVNGVAPSGPVNVKPGDVVTFRLRIDLSSGDQAAITLNDYLPAPIFRAEEYGNSPVFGGTPGIRFGPAVSLSIPVPTLTVSPSTVSNAVSFSFAAFTTTPSAPVTIDLLMDFTVRSEPQEDGLQFTNLALGQITGSGAPIVLSALSTNFVVNEPSLRISKGVTALSATNPGAGLVLTGTGTACTPMAAPYTSFRLATLTEQCDARNLDALDQATYTIVVENRGSQTAYGLRVRDLLPAGLSLVGGVTVTNGTGTALTSAGNLFDPVATGGLVITNAALAAGANASLGAYDPLAGSSGNNVAVIRFTVALTAATASGVNLDNQVNIEEYSNLNAGGLNFVGYTGGTFTDTARIVSSPWTGTKARVNTAGTNCKIASSSCTIRDTTSYSITLNIPEGTHTNVRITDTLPTSIGLIPSTFLINGLAPAAVTSASLPAGATSSVGAPTVTFPANPAAGFSINWGNLTNANNNAANESITITFDAVVLNALVAQQGVSVANVVRVEEASGGVNITEAPTWTVAEPGITLSTSVSPATVDQGDVVTITFTLTGTAGRPTAYDVDFSATLPAFLSGLTNAVVGGAPAPSVGPTIAGSTITASYASIAAGQAPTLSFQATVQPGVQIGNNLLVPGTVKWTSQPGIPTLVTGVANSLERDGVTAPLGTNDYSRTANATVPIKAFNPTKVVLNGVTNVRVGDLLDYRVTVVVPEGASSLLITDNFPAGLVFVSAQNFSSSGAVTCGGNPCALPTMAPARTINAAGTQVVWNFGALSNSDNNNATTEQLQFDLTVAVADVSPGATKGATLANSLIVNNGTNNVTTTATAVTVDEPTIAVSLSTNPTSGGDAADAVTVSARLRNIAGAPANSTANAHDVVFTVPFTGTKLTLVNNSFGAGTCPAPSSTSYTGNTATFAFTQLTLGTDCTFTFQATIDQSISFAETLTFNTTTTWSSLPGSVTTSQSPFSALAVERTGDTAGPGGAANTYRTAVPGTYATSGAATVVKTLVSTSSAQTTDPSIALGENATYRLRVTLPEGSHPNLQVVDTPPAGFKLLSVSIDNTSFGGGFGSNPTNANLNGNSGQPMTFSFGTVNVTGDNDPTNNFFDILVVGQGVFDAATPNSPVNSAQIRVNGASAGAAGPSPVTLVRPQARIQPITLSAATPKAGDTVNVTVPLRNNGTGPMCGATLTVPVPTGFTARSPATDTIDNDGDGSVDEADEAALLSTGVFNFAIAGCAAPTAQTVFAFSMTANAGIATTVVAQTATLGTYTTLSSGGVTLNPAADAYDNNATGGVDESGDPTRSVNIDPRAPNVVFTKTAQDLNGGLIEPGDNIRYTLTLKNTGDLVSTGLALTDALPTSVTYVTGTATSSQGAIFVNNNTVTATVGDLAVNATVTMLFDVKLNTPLAMGLMIPNQALYTSTDTYSNRKSDNPATLAVDDATVVTISSPNDTDGDGVPNVDDPAPTNPNICGDSDHDGCDDCQKNGFKSPNDDGPDADGDGLCDSGDPAPNDTDGDDDGVPDAQEPSWWLDTDGDGLVNALDPDSDNDGILDGTELGVTTAGAGTDVSKGFFVPDADQGTTKTDPLKKDTDNGGVADGAEDINQNGKVDPGEKNPLDAADDASAPADSDGDGLTNAEELAFGTNPNDKDSDDDGVLDGAEPNWNVDMDGDGLIDALDPDSDNDGLLDGTELGVVTASSDTDVTKKRFIADAEPGSRTSALKKDTDNGGLADGFEDLNKNGKIETGETDPLDPADDGTTPPLDSDNDGLPDAEELAIRTNPNDNDSDDDGIVDGAEPNYNQDTDGDGLINALDPDSDNDGLVDGLEAGKTTPATGTDVSRGLFKVDADPATRTGVLSADTDRGGLKDGSEDVNKNGKLDGTEKNPLDAADDNVPTPVDTDGDGLTDAEELAAGTNPNDADSDDDGVKDGAEPNWNLDMDGDGLIDALDADSDNDGLFDGTELGVTTAGAGTDVTKGRFVADADPTTTTNPLKKDTDNGGVSDGLEDLNKDGRFDPGELNPLDASDDVMVPPDADGDGLSDAEEVRIGTNPMDKDSDDDGVPDGAEPNYNQDTDGDGRLNALDADSDNDGLFDGTELGVTTPGGDTNTAAQHFRADADPTTRTSALLADTDRGGVADGVEDNNQNGKVDASETDPVNPADDDPNRDSDFDTIPDAVEGGADPDGDGIPNALDIDSDGDNITDREEAGDIDPKTAPVDTDKDGIPDYLDLDADGDGISDADEAGDANPLTKAIDSDGDGLQDFRDADSDNDTISDRDEAGDADPKTPPVDTDGDGRPDFRDLDADGDGLADAKEAGDTDLKTPPVDTDGDGLPNFRDPDSDGDGVGDGTDNCPFLANADQVDFNANGVGDACEGDNDGDGIPAAMDNCPVTANADQADQDGDGIGDVCDRDKDGDGYLDSIGISGGGCSSAGGPALWWALAAFVARRRREEKK